MLLDNAFQLFLILSGSLGGLGVALGAFGAHALRGELPETVD